MVATQSALTGLVVVERAGRIAAAACGSLLASLGARVIRVELAAEAEALPQKSYAERVLRTGGKERVQLDPKSGDFDKQWTRLFEAADVLVCDPPLPREADHKILSSLLAQDAGAKVVCAISPAGLNGTDLPLEAPDALVQAVSGVMAVTGGDDDRPEFVRVPVAQLTTAVIAVASILAALRVQRRDGTGQLIDLSLIEVMADQLRTHVPLIVNGTTRGFRIGCRHPLVAPWNVYRARDGWMMICGPSDIHWQGLLDIMERSDLKTEPKFESASARRTNVGEVDAIVQHWVGSHTIADAVAAIAPLGMPAGPAQSVEQVVADEVLRETGTVLQSQDGERPQYAAGNALRLSRTPAQPFNERKEYVREIPRDLREPQRNPAASRPRPPLEGVRVVELTRYAAGPLAGLVLASLGADVVKIETPGGEDCRDWAPRVGDVSGYFANYNFRKRSLVLDLRKPDAREQLTGLLADADVFLQNLRPGVLDRMGFGPDAVTARHERVVYASISGFGLHGPQLAALDTVMQGRLGLTAVTGDGRVPLRVGYSIADQLAGHYCAAGILASLHERERSGRGQIVDISMADAIAWLTQLAWNPGASESEVSQWQARDGWIVAAAGEQAVTHALKGAPTLEHTRAELVSALERYEILATPVLEADEVLAQRVIQERGSLYSIETGSGGSTSVFAVPSGLTLTPVLRAQRMARLGADGGGFGERANA
jgi:crotonobetainyl-CoA:carnitine CoA-transferase CaiB-like acyl-CoA transferase